MRIREQRRSEPWVVRGALGQIPTVIRAGNAQVDLFPCAVADVVDEDLARARLHAEPVGIAQTERPDRAIQARGRGEERVVVGDGAIGVDPQQLALDGVHRLTVAAAAVIADADVQLAVGAEVNAPAVVRPGRRPGHLQEDLLAARLHHVAVGREAAHAIVGRHVPRAGNRVVDVEEVVGGEIRIERDADEPLFVRASLTLTVNLMNGVGSSAPFLITLSAPVCSATKMRPSSATASAVGHVIPDATSASVNPAGTATMRPARRCSRRS